MMGSMMAQMALLSPSAADRMSMLVSCHECSENKEGLPDESESPSKMLSKTYSVFKLRLEDLAREHKSRRTLNGFRARQMNRQSFLFFGKPSRFLRAESLHLDTERTFQLEQFRPLFFYEEGRSYAVSAIASGSPDAVDEILRHFRQIVVDDVRDVLHVNPAGSQVRGDQHAEATLLKPSQRCGALRLRAVAMNHGGGEASAIQAVGNPFRSALGSSEHEALSRFLGQQTLQHFLLAVHGNFKRLVAHVFRGFRGRAEGKTHGIAKVILHDARHVAFHCRGEAHRLPLFRKDRYDALDCRKEAHVQHAVRFVENERTQRIKVEKSAIKVIFQPPRSRHHQPRSLANGLELSTLG